MNDELATATADTQQPVAQGDDLDQLVAEINAEDIDFSSPEGADTVDEDKKEQPVEVEAEDAEQNTEAPTAEDSDTPSDEDTDVETAEDSDLQEIAALEAPARWNAEEKELFAKADPSLAALIVAREKQSQAEITRRQQEAAQYRKQVEAGNPQLEEFNSLLTNARTQFGSKYTLTPQEKAQYLNEATTVEERNSRAAELQQYDMAKQADETVLRQMEAQATKAEQEEATKFVVARNQELAELMPEFSDPEKGAETTKAFMADMAELGASEKDILMTPAKHLALAADGLKYRKMMSKKASAKPAAKKVGKAVKSSPSKSGSNKSSKYAKAKANMKTEGDLHAIIGMGLDDELAALGI